MDFLENNPEHKREYYLGNRLANLALTSDSLLPQEKGEIEEIPTILNAVKADAEQIAEGLETSDK